MKGTVFLLEDDKSICELVRCALEMADVDTVCFNTVADFNAALNQHLPAVALLDIMLPDGSGLDVLKKLKQSYPQVACIMLSALGQESDKVKGLNLGADDYISKPFGVLELTARVNVALRKQAVSDVLVCGNISLDEKSMSVSIDGRTVELNNKEFHLLRFLMRNEGRALSRDAILDAVWGYDEGETRTVDNHIARLRKLGVHNIETVFGVGYKLGKSEVLK
ncbi:MAG: response regulator transcription factor [Christensenellales bacterium]|jgi:phosphate regulon response regulator phoB